MCHLPKIFLKFWYFQSFYIIFLNMSRLEKNTLYFFSLFVVLFARDRAVPARMAIFHDHGGQLCGFGWSALDAWSGVPLSQLAGTSSCHHLSPAAYAVLHLVRKRP